MVPVVALYVEQPRELIAARYGRVAGTPIAEQVRVMWHQIPRTTKVGGYTFPSREDYLACCAASRKVDNLDDATIVAVQRDWHIRGQNGCVFAMHAARTLTPQEWRYDVYMRTDDPFRVQRAIAEAIANPINQILSLLFPTIECRADMDGLLEVAVAAGCYQSKGVPSDSGLVALRYRLGTAESWIVGFAPLMTLPATRRAPFAELAIRTKVKTTSIHPELNNNTAEAHLADVALDFNPRVTACLISKSRARTAKLLGGESARTEAKSAKAKVTYGLSKESSERSQEDSNERNREADRPEARSCKSIESYA